MPGTCFKLSNQHWLHLHQASWNLLSINISKRNYLYSVHNFQLVKTKSFSRNFFFRKYSDHFKTFFEIDNSWINVLRIKVQWQYFQTTTKIDIKFAVNYKLHQRCALLKVIILQLNNGYCCWWYTNTTLMVARYR